MDKDAQKRAEEQILNYSKKIDFYTSEYTLEILAQKVSKEEYTVPEYQREFTWDATRKSKFIESLLIGLPVPFVFFWQNDETGKLEIVDGSQRLRTVAEYLENNLALSGLERLDLLNNTRFFDLPLSRQRKVLNKSIRGIILSDDTDIEARIDLFERINTGSKVANPAEVRRGALRGPFMSFLNTLSENPLFNKLAPVSTKQKNEREREELISRFFAYSDGLDDYRDDVSAFIFRYIKRMNSEFATNPNLKDQYSDRFNETLEFVSKSFEHGFRKTPKAKTTPRARFEAIFIGSYLALKQDPNLVVSKEDVTKILVSDGFIGEIRSDGANAIRRLQGRINYVRNALLGL
ncbi:MAG: DUF262 domain-containing protein [Zhongshania sp.]|uniref:DUF262 domain-containing protein n=1 Tax=Zhongshania sp. TaxID=1971902 RepID=UPI0026143C68|nr:DUF262 domain-containing protein [Zhongshania sp.]MDF1693049.1 DUF262 domain-containing protein [Zhongshania sp.]